MNFLIFQFHFKVTLLINTTKGAQLNLRTKIEPLRSCIFTEYLPIEVLNKCNDKIVNLKSKNIKNIFKFKPEKVGYRGVCIISQIQD
jgi:hypothetical protein